jgi:hypothetical protein
MRRAQVDQEAEEGNVVEDVVHGRGGGKQEQSRREVHQEPSSDRQAAGRCRSERLKALCHRLRGRERGDVRHGGQLGNPQQGGMDTGYPGEQQIPMMAMLNVRELMAQDGGQLVIGEDPDETAGHDHLPRATGGAEGDELLTGQDDQRPNPLSRSSSVMATGSG